MTNDLLPLWAVALFAIGTVLLLVVSALVVSYGYELDDMHELAGACVHRYQEAIEEWASCQRLVEQLR